MIYEVNGDLLNSDYEIFCHQVNCQDIMGGGLAKQVKIRYPEVYRAYHERNHKYLGAIDWVPTKDNRTCVNMYAQEYYGHGARFTDYIAFAECLIEIENYVCTLPKEWKIAFPYKIGCGLGGGDWTVISALITDFSSHIKQDVYIIKK